MAGIAKRDTLALDAGHAPDIRGGQFRCKPEIRCDFFRQIMTERRTVARYGQRLIGAFARHRVFVVLEDTRRRARRRSAQ